MADYITRSDLRSVTMNMNDGEASTVRKRAEERSPQGSIFLSHSSKDEELVTGAIRVLENYGGSVYVDKKDPTLPPYTSKETASTLKTRVSQAKKFILLASANSKDSRWVPWELGLADGYKKIENIAIFPAVDSAHDASWASWEYLGLYDRIVYGKLQGYEKNVVMVLDHRKNTATELSQWLNRY